ncbi:MAG: hypothetical protein ACR2HD_02480 [Solirubrobacteraceae bacterium]|nr:MAG: hypothetical protein DLM63_06755 [Solirubrobacterales bacterium]
MALDLSKLSRGEIIATIGGVILVVAVFLPWFHLNTANAHLNGHSGPASLSEWQAQAIVRYLLLASAIAPLVLAWIIARDHALSWPRGELTGIVAIIALFLIGYFGLISRPGTLRAETSLQPGWYVALVGALAMLYGAARRSEREAPARKPPGVI